MRHKIAEETVLFVSVAKWILLATIVGLIVGLSTTIFIKILIWSSRFADHHPYYFLILPAALIASTLIVKFLAPDARGHGTEKVIEAIHKHSGRIKVSVVPVKLIATIITIAAGGSVGKEGPCAQIGAGLTSMLASLLKFDDKDRKKLVICGISAGFASVFGTPISGAIFGVEVLFAGSILYDVLLPSFVAGITAHQVAFALGVKYFYHPLNFVPVFSEIFFLKVIASGIFFGLCSGFLIETIKYNEKLFARLKDKFILQAFWGGIILIVLTFVFSKMYLGLGVDTIEAVLQGEKLPWYAFIVKSIFTAVTLSCGGSGGIVTPIFFVGAAAGCSFAMLLSLDIATFSAIGLVSLLAGAANTPISASIMAVELFGPKLAPYAAVACVISFLMTGHRSVYPSQVLATSKSSSIKVDLGKEIEDIKAVYKPRNKSFIALTKKIAVDVKSLYKKIIKKAGD
ncbi:MAG: chloride channel protein [Phycisphaerales bacterium]